MEEVWKDIKGEPDAEISNLGNVRYKGNINNRPLYKDKDGYLQVHIHSRIYKVHRLVAFAFCDNPNPALYNCVNHKDEVKNNNVYTNLEWCDRKYNVNYGTNIKRMAESLSYGKIIEYDDNGNILNIYQSGNWVAKNIPHGAGINDAIRLNYFNRYFGGKYYFREDEEFDAKRKGTKRVYYLYKINDRTNILCKGGRRDIAKYLNMSVSKIANFINYYTIRNRDIIIEDYIITIELI